VELQRVAPTLAVNGVALFAVSYDSVAILRDFATIHGITYPLLSDEGSHAMRELGLINARVQEDHAAYGIKPNERHVNLPYPGVFVLDRDGVVVRRLFYASYRERDTGTGLIAAALGIVTEPSTPVAATNGPGLTARAWLDSPTYVFFQRLTLTVELSIAPGSSVYPPLSLAIDPVEGLEVGPVVWPQARSRELEDATSPHRIQEGVVRGTLPLTFTSAPGLGDHTLGVTVGYHVHEGVADQPSTSIRLEVLVREAALVGRSLPTPQVRPS
jgi:peroxiredoxin